MRYRNIRLYCFSVVLLFLGIVLASRSSGKNERAQTNQQEGRIKPIERIEDLRITNHTSSFNVVDIKKLSDSIFEITFQNNYSKRITGFEVSVGGMRVQTELTLGGDEGQFISPGGSYQEAYSAQQGLDRHGVQILAVVFDDGSGDGDTKYIKEITDYRFGMQVERQRVLALLEEVLKATDEHIPQALEELESNLSFGIASTSQNSTLDNVGLGTRNERRRTLEEISMLKKNHQDAMSVTRSGSQLRRDLVSLEEVFKNIIRLTSRTSESQKSSQ